MALTNFAALTGEEKTAWARETWKVARNLSFVNQFGGSGPNSMVQRISELRKDEKGARAVITLIADMVEDGTVGDYKLEDNEEALASYEDVIGLDQLRGANRLAGRMADQRSVVNFRNNSRDVLGYFLADRMDQLGFLTLSGVSYTLQTNGALRPVRPAGRNLSDLTFAGDVSAPTSGRHLRWNASTGALVPGDTTAVTAADKISYAALVRLRAYAKNNFIRGIRGGAGQELFHVFVNPETMATLKLDSDYLANVRNAMPRSSKNPLFAGTTSVMVDGMVIHEFYHVFNTAGATAGTAVNAGAPGYKWGADADVDGCRVLLCGAQALGMAAIGNPMWVEDKFDFENQQAISIGRIFGFLKPKFYSNVSGQVEDFGVVAMDVAH